MEVNIHEKISRQSRSIRELIYESLKEAILTGSYEPGFHLRERELAKEFQVSTTPVKEALRQLEKEGLTISKARRGSFVSPSIMSSVEEITLARAALEGVAAGLAAQKRTETEADRLQSILAEMKKCTEEKDAEKLKIANISFHQIIIEAAKNDYIANQIEAVRSFDQFIRKKAMSDTEEHIRAFDDHQVIYQKIRDKDAEGAEQAMRNHINRTRLFVLGKIKEETESSRTSASL